jgi:hypothetical protein
LPASAKSRSRRLDRKAQMSILRSGASRVDQPQPRRQRFRSQRRLPP